MGAENLHSSRKGPHLFTIDNKTGLVTPHTDAMSWLAAISDPWWKVQVLRVRLVWLRFVEWVRR